MRSVTINKSQVFFIFGVLMLFFVTACNTTLPYKETQSQIPEQYILAAGDKIDITSPVARDVEGEFVLSDEGMADLPLIGQTKLSGLTSAEADLLLIERYSDGYLVNPDLSIQVKNYRPFYILGEVENPGKYEYSDGLTLLNAVALAGGFTYRANQEVFDIVRGNTKNEEDMQSKREVNNLAVTVLPGDTVYVRERYF
jgi:protein involved in polysaccharide export with SLBB domain